MGGVGMLGGEDLALLYAWIMRNLITVRGQWMYETSAMVGLVNLIRSGPARPEPLDGRAVSRWITLTRPSATLRRMLDFHPRHPTKCWTTPRSCRSGWARHSSSEMSTLRL